MMTVNDLIEKLKKYPLDAELDCRSVGGGDKLVLIVEGYALDPVIQIKGSVQRGFGDSDPNAPKDMVKAVPVSGP